MPEFQTANLDLHSSGLIMVRSMPNACMLDAVECLSIHDPHWPAELGDEPDWFGAECDECESWCEVETMIAENNARAELVERWGEYYSVCIGRLT